jgi:rhamnosyltransferase
MKVSVIIPTCNGGPTFVRCAKSLVKQKFDHPWEVVIIDSESTDGSVEKARQVFSESELPSTFIRIDRKDFRHGPTRNDAIARSSGDIICLTTQDTIPENKSWLYELTLPFFTDRKIVGTFGRHLAHKHHPKLLSRNLARHFDHMNLQSNRFITDRSSYDSDEKLRQFLHFFSNNNSALRHSEWKRRPFPSVDFGEDQLWAKSVLEDGGTIAYRDSAVVRHSHFFGFRKSYDRTKVEMEYYYQHFGYDLSQPKSKLIAKVVKRFIQDYKWLHQNKCIRLSEITYSLKNHIYSNLAYAFVNLKTNSFLQKYDR